MSFVLTLNFQYEVNTSLQVGDNVYFSSPDSLGGYQTNNISDLTHCGTVFNILSPFSIEIESDYQNPDGTAIPANVPQVDSYISFSKGGGSGTGGGNVNQNEVVGYYAEARFSNNDTIKAELFSVASEITENSK
tara:strand:- start:302 stop:703 length:402 start_codon:yes stop_codon:yes gene_type:complete